MPNKQHYSQQFAKVLRLDQQDIMTTWWANLRQHGGLRLTPHAYDILCNDLEIESYAFSLPVSLLTAKNLLRLDKKLQTPYFLKRNKTVADIVLFGADQAIMASLYGNIEQWLQSLDGQ